MKMDNEHIIGLIKQEWWKVASFIIGVSFALTLIEYLLKG